MNIDNKNFILVLQYNLIRGALLEVLLEYKIEIDLEIIRNLCENLNKYQLNDVLLISNEELMNSAIDLMLLEVKMVYNYLVCAYQKMNKILDKRIKLLHKRRNQKEKDEEQNKINSENHESDTDYNKNKTEEESREEEIDLIYKEFENLINVNTMFTVNTFHEVFSLLCESSDFEYELFFLLKHIYTINILTRSECLGMTGEILLTKNFMIKEEMMSDIIKHVIFSLNIFSEYQRKKEYENLSRNLNQNYSKNKIVHNDEEDEKLKQINDKRSIIKKESEEISKVKRESENISYDIVKLDDKLENSIITIFTTDSISYLNIELRIQVIKFLSKFINNINLIRKIYYTITCKASFDIIFTFFELLSILKIDHIMEFNEYFRNIITDSYKGYANKSLKNIKNKNSKINEITELKSVKNLDLDRDHIQKLISIYTLFLINNRIKEPIYDFIKSLSIEFLIIFYTEFFKNKEDMDAHIIDFFFFFINKNDVGLNVLLNIIPYIPNSEKSYFLIYEIWLFILQKTDMQDFKFFFLKTPAITNICGNLRPVEKFVNHLDLEVPEEKLPFLSIIYFSEKAKVENKNFSGILEYIRDVQTLKNYGKELGSILVKLITEIDLNDHEYNLYIVYNLFLIAKNPNSFYTSIKISHMILKAIFLKDKSIKFIKKIHYEFKEAIQNLKNEKQPLLKLFISFYWSILEELKKTATNFYNYIIFCVADFNIFGKEFLSTEYNSFSDLYQNTFKVMDYIESFPDGFMFNYYHYSQFRNEGSDIDSDVTSQLVPIEAVIPSSPDKRRYEIIKNYNSSIINNSELDSLKSITPSKKKYKKSINLLTTKMNLDFLIDITYLRKDETSIIRSIVETLKYRINRKYEYSDLYILLKIYNILEIREEDTEKFLRFVLYKGLDFNTPSHIFLKLSNETTGFYRYYFTNLYFMSTIGCERIKISHKTCIEGIQKPYTSKFTKDEIISIYNTFKYKGLANYIEKKTLNHLDYFFSTNFSILDSITVLKNFKEKNQVLKSLNVLKIQKSNKILFYTPQLIQLLNLVNFKTEYFSTLLELSKNEKIAHSLIWCIKSNSLSTNYIKEIQNNMTQLQIKNYNNQDRFLNHLVSISTYLISHLNKSKEEKNKILNEKLSEISIKFSKKLLSIQNDENKLNIDFENNLSPEILISDELNIKNQFINVYIPFSKNLYITRIIKGRVLQSHAKVPFMVTFETIDTSIFDENDLNSDKSIKDSTGDNPIENNSTGDDSMEKSKFLDENENIFYNPKKYKKQIKNVIFKSGDDCRQDMLALQIISMFKEIFEDANLDIFLHPYNVIAIDKDCGVIEVIENAISRDEMGREKINNLVEYFELKFGFKESKTYLEALNNFVKSLAGYSLVVYFLNIKDRHNGNIMIDDKGHMIHIDFGFMLEISPGNLNIEIPLKLTTEIKNLLGGLDGYYFKKYKELLIKGFFALRRRSKEIIFLIDSFTNSGLPCYKKNAIQNLIKRFKFNFTDEEIECYWESLVNNSTEKLRTWLYDKYQEFTNDISF